jgi:hypothetical protein
MELRRLWNVLLTPPDAPPPLTPPDAGAPVAATAVTAGIRAAAGVAKTLLAAVCCCWGVASGAPAAAVAVVRFLALLGCCTAASGAEVAAAAAPAAALLGVVRLGEGLVVFGVLALLLCFSAAGGVVWLPFCLAGFVVCADDSRCFLLLAGVAFWVLAGWVSAASGVRCCRPLGLARTAAVGVFCAGLLTDLDFAMTQSTHKDCHKAEGGAPDMKQQSALFKCLTCQAVSKSRSQRPSNKSIWSSRRYEPKRAAARYNF